MRITIINQFYTPDISPTAHLAASLAQWLAQKGHPVTVVASQGGYVKASQVEQSAGENPRVFRLWTPRLGKKTILKRCIDYASFYLLAAYRMMQLPPQDVIDRAGKGEFRLIYTCVQRGAHDDKDGILYINPHWPMPDGCVEVPGYDIPILPASGVVQACIYASIVEPKSSR